MVATVSATSESAIMMGRAWRLAKEGARMWHRHGLALPSETM